jgi:hypothetical protein
MCEVLLQKKKTQYLNKEIKEASVNAFGECVARVHSLFFVQSDVNLV